jgi:hypothetical protein
MSIDIEKIEKARNKYKPDDIKYLFVAEAPPASLDRFFYFEDVKEQDSLFLEMMKWLIPESKNAPTPWIREHKAEFLENFKEKGCYLIDSIDFPMDVTGTNKKIKRLEPFQKDLLNKISKIVKPETKVILITAPVFNAMSGFLKYNNINISNTEMIDFPGSGRQTEFHTKMQKLFPNGI